MYLCHLWIFVHIFAFLSISFNLRTYLCIFVHIFLSLNFHTHLFILAFFNIFKCLLLLSLHQLCLVVSEKPSLPSTGCGVCWCQGWVGLIWSAPSASYLHYIITLCIVYHHYHHNSTGCGVCWCQGWLCLMVRTIIMIIT